MPKILITAGDISGDAHAARLMHHLKLLHKDIEFIGIGGEAMIHEGLISLASLKDISIVGFVEVVKNYSFIKSVFDKCRAILESGEITLFIPVDYPGFNIRLAKHAKLKKIPIIYYIAPQLWAWGKNRATKLAESVDKLLVVFPFEEEFFRKFGFDAEFVGHPLLDNELIQSIYPDNLNKANLIRNERESLIAFLPGSRIQEVKKHILLINKIAENLKNKLPGYKFGVAKSGLIEKKFYLANLDKNINWNLFDNTLELLIKSEAGIIKTGTSTLEAALCQVPFVMFYKTSLLNYLVAKRLINLEYVSLANILLKEYVVDEFIQFEATPLKISDSIINLIEDKSRYSETIDNLKLIHRILGSSGASERAAKIINKYLY